MSIEELFKAVIAALEANTKAVDRLEASLVGRTGGNSKPAKAEKPKAVGDGVTDDTAALKAELEKGTAEGKGEKSLSKSDAPTKEELQEAVADLKAEGVEYGTVRELVLKLAPTKREEIKALNAKFGIANLKVLLDKEDDFSTVNDQAKLDAIYAELQKLEA